MCIKHAPYPSTAFQFAVAAIKANGGGQLYVPAGIYLTTGFALTSNLSLFIDENATILGAPPNNSRCEPSFQGE